MIRKDHSKLSIVKQSKLLGINRSSFYYQPKSESKFNIELMTLIDKHYTKHPFKGARRMHTWLTQDMHYKVSKNRIERLYYKSMGLRAIMPGRHTSKRRKDHKVYPYLLRHLPITHSNHVWATDITYIPMQKGFMYLIAFIDLYSRKVLHWSVSNTMDASWCAEVLEETIQMHGKPDIVNTDQGAQFTSDIFSSTVLNHSINLSMDGKGRAIDNVFIERLWRSVKYESVYLNPPNSGIDLYHQLKEYFYFYNTKRRHQGIENQIPQKRYYKHLKQVA